jgi:uncharacterized protein (DUF736 family)
VDFDILPNTHKTSDTQLDFRVMTEDIEIGASWMHKGEAFNKEDVSLSIAAPEFGQEKLFGNFDKTKVQMTRIYTS